MDEDKRGRELIKAGPWRELADFATDQSKGLPLPPAQKSVPADSTIIKLIPYDRFSNGEKSFKTILKERRSRRKFDKKMVTGEELSFLLWATQGMRGNSLKYRTTPSGGSRHPFETYLVINRGKEFTPGLYRYLPREHSLLFLKEDYNLIEKTAEACLSKEFKQQSFIPDSAVIFIWTAVPYRSEWRYGVLAHKLILLEAGHICQNLYLACEDIDVGVCAIGAYDQEKMDRLLEVDGCDEFAVYVAALG